MFGLGYPELFVIALVALVVIGPRRLPEMMRQAGKLSSQLRRAANEFRRELELAADQEADLPARRIPPARTSPAPTEATVRRGSSKSADEADASSVDDSTGDRR